LIELSSGRAFYSTAIPLSRRDIGARRLDADVATDKAANLFLARRVIADLPICRLETVLTRDLGKIVIAAIRCRNLLALNDLIVFPAFDRAGARRGSDQE
jgi:hypothetical protein